MVTVRFRIADHTKLIARIGLVLALGSWVGWWHLANTTGAVLNATYMMFGPAVTPLLLFSWLRDASGIVSIMLVTWIVLTCDLLLIHFVFPLPLCDDMQNGAMFLTILTTIALGAVVYTQVRHSPGLEVESDEPSRRSWMGTARNLSLGGLALLALVVIALIPSIKWEQPRSAVLAVAKNKDGRLTVDFYGKGVNTRTVRYLSDQRVEAGGFVRFELLGRLFVRDNLGYDESMGQDSGVVRRIRFHRTHVTDQVIPLLRQFPNLEVVDVRQTQISQAGVKELRKSLPACQVLR